MWETDDRLAGDSVWELFPPPQEPRKRVAWRRWSVAAVAVGLGLWLCQPVAVVAACLAVSWGDLERAFLARRTIPDPWAARVSARFTYGWAFWKVGMTAIVWMFATISLAFPRAGRSSGPPPAFMAAMFLWMGGFLVSAVVTASGLVVAIRKGLRVWIGEGVNQARMLLLTMLVVGFTAGVLIPFMLYLTVALRPTGVDHGPGVAWMPILVGGLFGCMFVGPVVLLLILDAVARRVIADEPAKFGPKVAAVGKWARPGAKMSHSGAAD